MAIDDLAQKSMNGPKYALKNVWTEINWFGSRQCVWIKKETPRQWKKISETNKNRLWQSINWIYESCWQAIGVKAKLRYCWIVEREQKKNRGVRRGNKKHRKELEQNQTKKKIKYRITKQKAANVHNWIFSLFFFLYFLARLDLRLKQRHTSKGVH